MRVAAIMWQQQAASCKPQATSHKPRSALFGLRLVAWSLLAVPVLLSVPLLLAQQDKSQRISPPAKVELMLNGRKVTVEYSRPQIRDPKTGQPRKIMGGVVPYGIPWRTGANEATAFVTEGEVSVGGVHLPKGSYTLYTLPNPDSWWLIISKKTGQWGDPYPGAQEDFAVIPMQLEHPPQAVESFTITLDPPQYSQSQATPARLCLAWENTKACVTLAPE
jgi:hypothetical protein